MKIGEVSQKYGLTLDTLRYYEQVGMIPPVHRLPNGQRDYTETDLNWVGLAKCLREAGLSVETIKRYSALVQQGDSTFGARIELFRQARRELEMQKESIEHAIAKLDYKMAGYQRALETGVARWDCEEEDTKS